MSKIEESGEKKVPRYLQFYKQEWERLPIFKGWLSSVPGSRHRAYCRYCRKEFRAHRTDLRSHAKSRKHQRASETFLSQYKKVSEPTPQTVSLVKVPNNQKKCSVSPGAISEEGPSDNVENSHVKPQCNESFRGFEKVAELPDTSPPSPDSDDVLEIIHPKKVRAYLKGKEKRWKISTQVLDLVRGIPVCRLGVSLLYEKENSWSRLGDGTTDGDGQWQYSFSNGIKAGRYKFHFESKKYFTLGLHDTCYPYIEVVFDISDSVQQYHVPLLVSPFGYMVYRGGK